MVVVAQLWNYTASSIYRSSHSVQSNILSEPWELLGVSCHVRPLGRLAPIDLQGVWASPQARQIWHWVLFILLATFPTKGVATLSNAGIIMLASINIHIISTSTLPQCFQCSTATHCLRVCRMRLHKTSQICPSPMRRFEASILAYLSAFTFPAITVGPGTRIKDILLVPASFFMALWHSHTTLEVKYFPANTINAALLSEFM